ncbi:biotin/lipoyl-containing protein, partial [Burkholderia stabilis]
MGIHVIKMPDIGEGIAEVELVAWHVEVGQTIKEDQPLADVMTDKAAVEIPSPVTGKVIELGGRIGEMMAVGSELIRLEVEGDGNLKAGAPVRETKVETAPVAATPSKPAADVPAEK